MASQNQSVTSLNVDVGGTFTDCFCKYEGGITTAKTPTTEYDISQGFLRSVEACSENMGISIDALLEKTDIIRYSTTVALNNLIERKGPRLGLITTEGFQDTIYIGKGAQWSDGLTDREKRNLSDMEKPKPLVPKNRAVGVEERVTSDGEVLRTLNEDDVREKLHYLVDQGVRGIAVCLHWAFENPAHEQRIREIIREEYPDSYIGSMPVVLSHEVLPKQNEYQRMMTTILNTYLHESMAEELSTIYDEIRSHGYENALMLVHNTGGMTELFKTTAVRTYNAGPVAGLKGSEYWANRYGFDNAILADMGGTSFDIGLITGSGVDSYQTNPVIDRWMVGITMLETQSIGAGGGSIGWINEDLDDTLQVGPKSAGANPGPAAYGQGGRQPTVTDADVILGYIDPESFKDGEMELSRRRAERAIERQIARPLDMSVEEAAWSIKRIVDGNMGNTILKETIQHGHDPRDFIMFVVGGAGPTHCCGFNEHVEVSKMVTLPYSPVFGAFGASTMDVLHAYERSKHIPLLEPGGDEFMTDYEEFNGTVDALKAEAKRDVTGEGFDPSDIDFTLELDLKFANQIHEKRIVAPRLYLEESSHVEATYEHFVDEYANTYSHHSVNPESGINIEGFILQARVPRPDPGIESRKTSDSSSENARIEYREVYWGDGYDETPIYRYDDLQPGNHVDGPAVIQSGDTTHVIDPDSQFEMDEFRNGVITKR